MRVRTLQRHINEARRRGDPMVLVPGNVGEILSPLRMAQLRVDYAKARGQRKVSAATPPGEATTCPDCEKPFWEGQLIETADGRWTCWQCDFDRRHSLGRWKARTSTTDVPS